MFCSHFFKTPDYIKCLCLAIGVVCATEANCGALMHFFAKKKVVVPWKGSCGYIPGQTFDGIITDEAGNKFVLADQSEEKHEFVDDAGVTHVIGHNKSGEYSFTGNDKKKYPVKGIDGKVVIIVFSTTWCPNCPGVVKQLEELQNKLQQNGVDNVNVIHLNVGTESSQEVKSHLKSIDSALETYQSVPHFYMKNIRGVPAVLIFDKKGKPVCGYMGGGYDYLGDEFAKFITELAR